MTIKYEVLGRWGRAVQFTAEIECEASAGEGAKLGLAVRWARETGANLSGAYLSRAYLRGADLRGADLSRAYLRGADLSGADLSRADLSGADLSGADLRGAYLRGAPLSRADLRGADLRGAYLRGADLSRADLRGADLSGAKDAELAEALTVIAPEGVLIGWKKCAGGVIVKLEIPADAKRSNATGRKCRAEFAKVLDTSGLDSVASYWDAAVIYRVGEMVRPTEPFCEDRWRECAAGIHFFITRAEAEAFDW